MFKLANIFHEKWSFLSLKELFEKAVTHSLFINEMNARLNWQICEKFFFFFFKIYPVNPMKMEITRKKYPILWSFSSSQKL